MGIHALKKINPTQGAQKVQGQSSQAQNVKGSSQGSGSSLVERLNSMDNKLNQGGGVSLSDSSAGQIGGQDEMIRKHKAIQ